MKRMNKSFYCLLALLFAWAPVSGEDARETARFGTYNVRNYVVMDRMVEGQWRPSYPKPEKEKRALRAAILEVRPDVLALQEMGPRPFLNELREDLAEEGLEYRHAVHMEAADKVRHLAVLSKISPAAVIRHDDLDFKYFDAREVVKRGLLEVVFDQPDGVPLRVFVVHLKSHWSDIDEDPESDMRRAREARACRKRILERLDETGTEDFLVAGDFNDHPASAPLRRFYQRGERKIGTLVPAADSRGEVWTHFYEKQGLYSQVDGFIASQAVAGRVHEGRGHVFDQPKMSEGSDHRLVYLDLEW